MNIQIEILTTISVIAIVSFIVSVFCLVNLRKLKTLAKANFEQIEFLENSLAKQVENLEKNKTRFEAQARHISLLENDFLRPRELSNEIFDEATQEESFEMNLLEQKQQILSLAQHGQDTKLIAEAVGMMPGEVELIVNLNRTMPNYA